MNRIITIFLVALTIIGMASLGVAGAAGLTVINNKGGTYENVQLLGHATRLCVDEDGFNPSNIGNINVWQEGNEAMVRTLTDRYVKDAMGIWSIEFACGDDITIPGRETAGLAFVFKYLYEPASIKE